MSGKELEYIQEALDSGKISGNGGFTQRCQQVFRERFGFRHCLLTTSCTDALEMAAILLDIVPGDEVIMPSYTFVSTANAFVLRGANIVFADSEASTPNMDAAALESLITPKTKAIVVVHYAGMACDMDAVMDLADRYGIFVVEDAAQAIDSYYVGSSGRNALGGIGHLAAFSFHETKNIISGEGGMLVVNDERFVERSEIIWEKGTNRSAFFRGEVDKYGWVDVGSSFLPSELNAAFLFAQLENLDDIQAKRRALWDQYFAGLRALAERGKVGLPHIPDYATNNAHMFYMLCSDLDERGALIAHLRSDGIHAVFHYLSLHSSPYYADKHDGRALRECARYSERLVRLPLFYELETGDVTRICGSIHRFYEGVSNR